MSDLSGGLVPGHLAWHGPLALLAPGLWLLIGALALVIIPRGRGRTVIAWGVLLIAALVTAACWRAAWVAGIGTGAADSVFAGWHRDYAAGWVHGGLPWLVAGSLAAVVPLIVSGRSWILRLALSGLGYLLLVGLIWWAQLVAAALLISALHMLSDRRTLGLWLILLLAAAGAGAVAAYTAPAEPIDPAVSGVPAVPAPASPTVSSTASQTTAP